MRGCGLQRHSWTHWLPRTRSPCLLDQHGHCCSSDQSCLKICSKVAVSRSQKSLCHASVLKDIDIGSECSSMTSAAFSAQQAGAMTTTTKFLFRQALGSQAWWEECLHAVRHGEGCLHAVRHGERNAYMQWRWGTTLCRRCQSEKWCCIFWNVGSWEWRS